MQSLADLGGLVGGFIVINVRFKAVLDNNNAYLRSIELTFPKDGDKSVPTFPEDRESVHKLYCSRTSALTELRGRWLTIESLMI